MKCTDKERETCNVEKMGCDGCYYNEKPIKYTPSLVFPNKEIMEDALKHMRGE